MTTNELYAGAAILVSHTDEAHFRKDFQKRDVKKMINECRLWFVRDNTWPDHHFRCWKAPGGSVLDDILDRIGVEKDGTFYVIRPGDFAALAMITITDVG